VFEGQALTQLRGLPEVAFDALVERVADLAQEPWATDLMAPEGSAAYRQAIFGRGYGLLTFRVDEVAELVSIFDIAWIG
jgi:hypothetical protein